MFGHECGLARWGAEVGEYLAQFGDQPGLYGGANEAVMYVLDEITEPAEAEHWLLNALADKRKVMGFGHRVYKNGDSRVPTMRACLEQLAERRGAGDLLATCRALEAVMVREKGLHPNLDFPAGPAYHLMGFDVPLFTPIFVMARIAGWTAHVIEQHAANALIRPLAAYAGPNQRSLPA